MLGIINLQQSKRALFTAVAVPFGITIINEQKITQIIPITKADIFRFVAELITLTSHIIYQEIYNLITE